MQSEFFTEIYQIEELNPNYLKEYLIRKKKLDYHCNRCGLNEWQNEPLALELNFKDFDINNQSLNNLEFLCPNCYAIKGENLL